MTGFVWVPSVLSSFRAQSEPPRLNLRILFDVRFPAEAANFGTLDLQNCNCFAFQEWFEASKVQEDQHKYVTNTKTKVDHTV